MSESTAAAGAGKRVRKKVQAAPAPNLTRTRFNPLAPDRVRAIMEALRDAYPGAHCELRHRSAWELLAATILSAQCTDVRVNLVTPILFDHYPTVATMAQAAPEEIEPLIRSTGFFRNKAKSLVGAARRMVAAYCGHVPDTMEDLLSLPGVARKTANVVLGVWYRKAVGVVVDTHVQRIAHRLQFTRHTDPKHIEQDLMRLLPERDWIDVSHLLIWHGRRLCRARKPQCRECPIETQCHAKDKTWRSAAGS